MKSLVCVYCGTNIYISVEFMYGNVIYTCLAFVYRDNFICFKIIPERSPRTIHFLFSGFTSRCILLVIKLRPMCANTLSFSLDLWIIFIIAAAYSLLYGVYNFMRYSLLYVSFAFLLSWFHVHLYSVNLTFLNY